MKRLIISLITASVLSACTLAPHYRRPESPVPDRWPSDTGAANTTGSVDVSASGQPSRPGIGDPSITADQIGWRDFFTDPRLQHLIEIALENNRNLRIAVLTVAASEAEYRVQRGALFPAISATGSGLVEKLPANATAPLSGLGGPGDAVTGSSGAAPGTARGSGDTPLSGSTPRLNDNVTFGGRYTYNFMKQLGIQLSAGYTPTRAAHVGSGDSDLGLTTVDVDAVWYVIPDYSLAGHKFSAYTEAGVGYAWAHLNHDLFGFAADRPVTITDSNGYTANAGLGAKYYLWDNFFVDFDARYRYLSKLTSAYGQGLNTAETTLSLGYQF